MSISKTSVKCKLSKDPEVTVVKTFQSVPADIRDLVSDDAKQKGNCEGYDE